MGKKAREYKSGDFIFAKVKGYPAWPARVQRLNGKKYFVYFYGTGETANLPPNMIFDYAENKDKFLNKAQKRRDFNEGVKQIEFDFANNVPLEKVIGVPMEVGPEAPADDTANDSAINDTMDETADTTAANDTADDDTITNQNDAAVDDSDENGALVIDEGKTAKKKNKPDAAKTPAKETPKAKEQKTPRGKAKKDETKKDDKEKPEEVEEEKKEEEIVSRSGRKIRPKRFVDEQTEENSTLPSPAPKKRRGASPVVEKEKEKPEPKDKNIKSFNAVTQSELEELKQPFKPEDSEKENIMIAYLPTGKYVGIKLFQSRPSSFKNESTRLQWDKQAASNAITLRMQLERGQITALSVQGQLVMDLNLTDEEKATLDKERETEEKKSRVQFLKNEMKLIELDAKIKTCLSLEKADTELCLKMLDELIELDVKPLMLLKHPTCLETVKRMRAYVGNTPSWDLSEQAALLFSKQAHRIRKQADSLYKTMKELFTTPDGLSFWEFFSERVLQFKKIAAKLSASELLEMVHEPIEMSHPTSHTMKAAIDAANDNDEDEPPRKKATPAKPKKAANNATPVVSKSKRQSSRKQVEPETEKNSEPEEDTGETADVTNKDVVDNAKESEAAVPESTEDVEMADATKDSEEPTASDKESEISHESCKSDKLKDSKKSKNAKEGKKSLRNAEKNAKDAEKNAKDAEKAAKDAEKTAKEADTAKDAEESSKDAENDVENAKDADHSSKDAESNSKDADKPKEAEANVKKDKSPKKSSKDREKSPRDKNSKDTDKSSGDAEKNSEEPEKSTEIEAESTQEPETNEKIEEPKEKSSNKKDENKKGDKNSKESDKNSKESSKEKESEKRKADDKADEKTREEMGEPRAKRSRDTRETKKTEAPPPRSPNKRKSKF